MPRKLLYLVSEDWYFVSHRLPMARAAKAAGYEVHVATRTVNHGKEIEAEGFKLHAIDWRRGSMNIFRLLSTMVEIRKLYRRLRPDLTHHVALIPTVVGSLAALGLPMVRLNAFAGLGYVFASNAAKARFARLLAAPLLGWLLTRPDTFVLVQNPDDQAVAMALGVLQAKIGLIPGSGVDVDALTPMLEPTGPFTIGFVGRLLYDKGVQTLVDAHDILRARGKNIRTLLAGEPDRSNPASIPEEELTGWRKKPGLLLLGHVDDIRTVWTQAHVAVLPSRREGLPLSLLEAAACARPLIATDVPGCREIARHGVNALLVPPDDANALADAVETLMEDRDLRTRLGKAGRELAVNEFSNTRIAREIVTLYACLLDKPLSAPLPQRERTA
jgi:glycosyltransferase involved in cell wall biosynthesis